MRVELSCYGPDGLLRIKIEDEEYRYRYGRTVLKKVYLNGNNVDGPPPTHTPTEPLDAVSDSVSVWQNQPEPS